MLRKELMKTQIYLFSLAAMVFLIGFVYLLFAALWQMPSAMLLRSLFYLILIVFFPIFWAVCLFKIPKKYNLISLIFPIFLLWFVAWTFSDMLVDGDFFEAIFIGLFTGFIPLILSFVGIFFILKDTFNFQTDKRLFFVSSLTFLTVLIILVVFYFNYFGGNLSDLSFSG